MDKNFLETFSTFFKKLLDMVEEHVYNVPVATKQEERNKEKHKASEAVKENQGQRKKVSKSA